MALDPQYGPEDFVRPGHINPLRSRDGGVLVRTGQTEGGVDLARLAGCYPASLVIEIVRADGKMARRDDLSELVREAILTSEGYRVVERRRWNFTEQFFKERTQ